MKATFTHFIPNFSRIIWQFRAVILAQLALLVVGAVVIAFVEKLPFGDALYFSLITGLTIGYGDVVVKNSIGRFVAVLIGLIGILFTGLVVAAAVRAVQITYHLDKEPE